MIKSLRAIAEAGRQDGTAKLEELATIHKNSLKEQKEHRDK